MLIEKYQINRYNFLHFLFLYSYAQMYLNRYTLLARVEATLIIISVAKKKKKKNLTWKCI